MTTTNQLVELLRAPLGPKWTIDALAERVLEVVATRPADEVNEFVLDIDDMMERQARRLIRPLLACLAVKSASEAGLPENVFGGTLAFRRPGPDGAVWLLGQFDNRLEKVRLALRRSNSPPADFEANLHPPCVLPDRDVEHLTGRVPG